MWVADSKKILESIGVFFFYYLESKTERIYQFTRNK